MACSCVAKVVVAVVVVAAPDLELSFKYMVSMAVGWAWSLQRIPEGIIQSLHTID